MKKNNEFNEYQIIGIHEDYILIMGTSYEGPLPKLSLIEKELSSRQYKGRVVFDLLLSNGKSSNRYVSFNFDNNSFDKESFQVLPEVGFDLVEESRKYFEKNKELLNHGVLTDQERFSILYP
jgi:hypothetical protein